MSKKMPQVSFCLLIALLISTVGPPNTAWGHDGPVILECNATGTGGASISSRGVLFTVNRSFASVELRMAASSASFCQFTAELRRSSGFTGPILAAVRIEHSLPATTSLYGLVHIDFPPVTVNGNESFTLRFVDNTSGLPIYIYTTTFNTMPCPNALITDNIDTYNPTPIASAAGLRVMASPAGCAECPGDINGDHVVDLNDFQILSDNWLKVCIPTEMPLLKVVASSIPASVVSALAEQFGLNPKLIQNDNGILRYTNLAKFQALPTILKGNGQPDEEGMDTVLESIDFDTISGRVLSDKAALSLVSEALAKSGLAISPGLEVIPTIGHTMFQAVGADGKEVIHVPLDTQVNYQFKFGTIPITGPGAKMKFVLTDRGELIHLTLALPAIQTGGSYQVIPQEEADSLAQQIYGFNQQKAAPGQMQSDGLAGVPHLTSQLVYWAPADAPSLVALQPHYLYGGTVTNPLGGPDITLRYIRVPAYQPAVANVLPKVQLFIDNFRNTIYAGTETWDGTPPYTYAWTSSTTNITYFTDSSIQYKIIPRPDIPDPAYETVTVVVTDAAGMSVSETKTVALLNLDAALASDPPQPVGGVLDVGTEWIGLSQGLGGSANNAAGFVTQLGNAGAHVRFNWGDNNAWERDFKDPTFAGGDDTSWIDNVDAAFYTGHANGSGFTFSSAVNDGFLHFNDARWGNNDLEWLVIAACGPLQLDAEGKAWHQRWGPAFQRLHLLLAYQTASSDNTVEGTKYAQYLLAGYTVRQAWTKTAIEVQPAGVRYGVMGAFGSGGVSNWNDHYWGKGTVGPDIWPAQKTGYWLLHGPT